MVVRITSKYLWLPVRKDAKTRKLHFYARGEKFNELDVKLDVLHPDRFFGLEVGRFTGQEIEIEGDVSEEALGRLTCREDRPDPSGPDRPLLHFTAPAGWINDPNGLVYADGIYHLYYQWNPFGTEWGNMHWGHAVSRDLLTWEHRPMALAPDEFGTVYSGCGWQDREGAAGFGKNALLFYYTAAGGSNAWSTDKGNKHTQRIAVSTDGGETLQKAGTVIGHIKGENRDPKVFWHAESGAYILVLYLEGNEFAIFRSKDLLHWQESDRFSAERMWECPGLVALPIEGRSGEKKWVFGSADGYYQIGTFDGFTFRPETEVLAAYDTKLAYAAQTFAGVEGRVISMAWLRTISDKGGFRGMMSIPTELSLRDTAEGLRLCFQPVRELWECFTQVGEAHLRNVRAVIPLSDAPMVVRIDVTAETPVGIEAGEAKIEIARTDKTVLAVIDRGIVEYFADDGRIYGAVETGEDVLSKDLLVAAENASVRCFRIAGMKAGDEEARGERPM